MEADNPDPGAAARRLMRSCDHVALASSLAGHPYVSLVASACEIDASPLLLLSELARGHLVAGFGRIAWIEAEDLRLRDAATALAKAEADIIAHMNADHADAIGLYAERLLGRRGAGWRMTGIDPEGIDLRREGET